MTEYIEPQDVDELVEDEGFHYGTTMPGVSLRADVGDDDRYIRLVAGANPRPLHDVELWLDKHTFPWTDQSFAGDDRVVIAAGGTPLGTGSRSAGVFMGHRWRG